MRAVILSIFNTPDDIIGGDSGGTVTFSGLIDDVRISEGALKPSEFMKASERTEVLPGLIIKIM